MHAFPKFDPRTLIPRACDELPCSASTFLPALMALDHDAPSVSDTALSKALRGNGDLSPEKYKGLLDKLSECKALKESAGGIPVAFTNAQVIHGLLMERRRLNREVKAPPQTFGVTVRGHWFVERNKCGDLITTAFSLMGSKMDSQTAERVSAELQKLGLEDVEVIPSPSGGNAASFERLMGIPEPTVDPVAVSTQFEAQ